MKNRSPALIRCHTESDRNTVHSADHFRAIDLALVVESDQMQSSMNSKKDDLVGWFDSSGSGLAVRVGNADRDVAAGGLAFGEGEDVGWFVDGAETAVEI